MNTNGMCRQQYRISLKIWKWDGSIQTYNTRKTRRFYAIVKANNFKKAHLKISYGLYKTNFGNMASFYNEADCKTKEELEILFNAFMYS
jgi:hypothetical protein